MAARRDLANRLGAEHATWAAEAELKNQVSDWTNGDGPPLIIETSGEVGVLPQAIEMVSPAGRVVVVGMSEATAPVRPGAFPEKEIDVLGTSCATADDFLNADRPGIGERACDRRAFFASFPAGPSGGGIRIRHAVGHRTQ